MEEEDRISLLPDFLLAHILSRLLYTEEAIRTGILSKRWRRLWTLLPKLKFSYDLFGTEKRSVGDFLSFVDQTLTHCGTQFNLHKFALGTRRYAKEFQSQVNDFLHYAVSRNVQELELVLQNIDHVIDFELRSDFMFTNSCLTSLTLSGLKILPVGTICWNKLRSLCIAHVKLDESLLQNILSGSPFLEYLCLTYCYGIRQIDITSKSVKEFMFSGYRTWGEELVEFPDIIEINAPHILALTIKQYFFILKPILLNVSSLVQAKLDYEKEYHGTMQNGAAQELLKLYILRLSHVKELIIGTSCSKAFRRLKSKGFTFPSNLKIVDVFAPSQSDSNEIGDSEEALLDDIWF